MVHRSSLGLIRPSLPLRAGLPLRGELVTLSSDAHVMETSLRAYLVVFGRIGYLDF